MEIVSLKESRIHCELYPVNYWLKLIRREKGNFEALIIHRSPLVSEFEIYNPKTIAIIWLN